MVSSARTGLHGLAEDLRDHRALVGSTNAVVARTLVELEDLLCGPSANAAIVDRLGRAWRSRSFGAFYERPLLLVAALRHEALSHGASHPLASALAADAPDVGAVTAANLAAAMDPDRLPIWLTLATRKVQTNDVTRSVAWRWPASLLGPRPVVLVDVGCAAGLNLVADRLAIGWTTADGRALPMHRGNVLARLGFDADPLDATRPAEVQWLRACVWAGDTERLARLEAAIAAVATAADRGEAPRLERVRAQHVPSRLHRIERAADPHACIVVVQSFVREYLDPTEAVPYMHEMQTWLQKLPPGRAMWSQLELAAEPTTPPAEIVVRAPGTEDLRIARCGYHPRVVEIEAAAFTALRDALARP